MVSCGRYRTSITLSSPMLLPIRLYAFRSAQALPPPTAPILIPASPLLHNPCFHTTSMTPLAPLLNSTLAVKHVIVSPALLTTSATTVYFPGGISLGRSTSFASLVSLSLWSGHSRSTLPTVSQRSAVWRMMVMRPYLTCRWIWAPASTSLWRIPEAETERVDPLCQDQIVSMMGVWEYRG